MSKYKCVHLNYSKTNFQINPLLTTLHFDSKIKKMKNIILNLTIILNIIIVPNLSNAQPTITSFTPMSGEIGTIVTITGTNFNSISANNIVFFGATQANVTSSTITQIEVVVPIGATYQYISITDITSNLTSYSEQPFIVTFSGCGVMNSSSFAPKVDLICGDDPRKISLGDLDGDGKVDVTSANFTDNTISVFRNSSIIGTVSFDSKIDILSGDSPIGISTNDIDGDGKLDIIVANTYSAIISVFQNTCTVGNISFATKVDFDIQHNFVYPRCITIGDMDGDGKPDIITGNNKETNSYSDISILINIGTIGNISFAPNINFPTGANFWPQYISNGDLDGDGKSDIVIANSYGNTISILRNIGAIGNISFSSKIDFISGTSPYSVSIGDIDGDGKPDLISANLDASTFSVLRNISSLGNISFDSKIDFITGICLGGTQSYSTFITDMNGDGKPDLLVSNGGLSSVAIFLNTSTPGAISFSPSVEFITDDYPMSIAVSDIDGDGVPDICTGNHFGSTISVLKHIQCAVGILAYDEPSLSSIIYPNPSFGIYTIELNDNFPHQIEIFNPFGMLVTSKKVVNRESFDLTNVPVGIYILKIDGIAKRKLIKE